MQSFKAKSLKSGVTDQQIATMGGGTRFMSFEAAIRMFQEAYPDIKEKPTGYRVTEQGIELIYE